MEDKIKDFEKILEEIKKKKDEYKLQLNSKIEMLREKIFKELENAL